MRFILALILAVGIASFTAAFAQTAPVPPATCEQRLDEAQTQNLQLRKRIAQAEFQSAAVEEIAIACQKKASETDAKTKAAKAPEKKP